MKKKIMALSLMGMMIFSGSTFAATYGDIKGDYSDKDEIKIVQSEKHNASEDDEIKKIQVKKKKKFPLNDQSKRQVRPRSS